MTKRDWQKDWELCQKATPGPWKRVRELEEKNMQLQVQLAGCATAAQGIVDDSLQPGDYGWSPAYDEIIKLQKRMQELKEFLERVIEAPSQAREIMEQNGLVIDNLDDPMQKLAFTFYNTLVKLATLAEELQDNEDDADGK